MIARAPRSILDPPDARNDTHKINLETIDERSPIANYAGSQDTSSENEHVSTRRCPVPPQANPLVLERTQRSREPAQVVAPSSPLNIIPAEKLTENTSNKRHSSSSNYAGSQDTPSENDNINTRRYPVPPQANPLVLERIQRAREMTTNVGLSSSSNIILENI